jgi:hypothetical protein
VAVESLLRDLGPKLQRGSRALAQESAGRLATGIASLDALLGGGFPTGRLSEIAGPASSGRTSLARALLASATRRGEWVAWVDGAGAFDAGTATSAGVALERMLWVRPPGPREAARCCECLLDVRGFALVVLDLAVASRASPAAPLLPAATWQRLARRSAGCGSALLVLSHARETGAFSDLVLEMQPGRAHFSAAPCAGAPALLEGLSIEARVARHRSGPTQRTAEIVLPATGRAA